MKAFLRNSKNDLTQTVHEWPLDGAFKSRPLLHGSEIQHGRHWRT
jgi:hypothetical protein